MRTKVLLTSLIISLLSAGISFAAVKGQVRNTNQVPVPGATVTFINESNPDDSYTATTDDEGKYEIPFTVGVDETTPQIFSLKQNYPNPFNPATTIPFSLEKGGFVDLSIYNVLGQKVRTLLSSHLSAGSHTVTWNCLDDAGKNVGSGIYIYQLRSGSKVESKKCFCSTAVVKLYYTLTLSQNQPLLLRKKLPRLTV